MSGIDVVPATAERWSQLGHVFDPREKDPDSCWCHRFTRHDQADNRSALHRKMAQAVRPIGLLACANDDAIGWTRVVPRSTLPGVPENRALARILDEDPDPWWVSCFVVAANIGAVASESPFSTVPWSGLRRARSLRAGRSPSRHRRTDWHTIALCTLHRLAGHVPGGRIHRDRAHLPNPTGHATIRPARRPVADRLTSVRPPDSSVV